MCISLRPIRLACLALLVTVAGFTHSSVQAAPTFAVFGDWGDANGDADNGVTRVSTLVHTLNPDFIVTVGDNNYGSLGAGHANWGTYVGQYYGDYMQKRVVSGAAPYNTQTGLTQRFFPAVGNHDSGGPGPDSATGGTLVGYLDFFHDNPGGSPRLPAGVHTTSASYYDFVSGGAHFWIVDSDHAKASVATRTAQQNWLQTGLQNSAQEFNFVFFHHAAFSSGTSHGSDPEMQWPFQAWGADAVFTGHDHTYERVNKNGLPYFVAGLGGRDLDGLGAPIAGSQAMFNSQFGALVGTVSGTSATFEFRHVNDGAGGANGGVLVDSLTINHALAPVTTSFREGDAGYTGTQDTHLRQASPGTDFGAASILVSDQDDPGGTGNGSQVLLRFDNLFGGGSGQIPPGANIVSASLSLKTGNTANDESATTTSLLRMLQAWTESSTWNSLVNGVSNNGVEAVLAAESTQTPDVLNDLEFFDVTASLQAWSANPALNFGWVLLPNGTNGWRFNSSEAAALLDRPQLVVTYSVNPALVTPEPAAFSIAGITILLAAVGYPLRRR